MERKYSKVDYNGLLAIEMFEKLKYRINYNVNIEYVNDGKKEKITDELSDVVNFDKIVTPSGDIPFFGEGFAIIKITSTQSGEVLYENKILSHTNTPIDQIVLDFSRRKTYGDKIATKQLARKQKQIEKNASNEERNKFVKELIISSKDYIKEELLDEWMEFIYKYSSSYDTLQILNVLIATLKRIEESNDLDNVESYVLVDGYEASIITCAIIYFSNKSDLYVKNKLKMDNNTEEKKKTL